MQSFRYFQPYSQQENVATNAILLLLSHVHRLAPHLLQEFLTSFTENEFLIGPQFINQERKKGGKSVVDAVIRQTPIEINIETKLGNNLDDQQIENHIKGIKKEGVGHAILISITRDPLSEKVVKKFRNYGGDKVSFTSITFSEIFGFFEDKSENFLLELNEILEDFRQFLLTNKLLPKSENRLIINPCSASFETNRKFDIYHDQPGRTKEYCKYLGCYRDKSVRLIGEVKAVFIGKVEGDKVKIIEQFELPWQNEKHKVTNEEKQRILDLADSIEYFDLRSGLERFWIVDKFFETDFNKSDPYGIQGHRYFQLDGDDVECPDLFKGGTVSAAEIAHALKSKSWQSKMR